MTAEKYQTTADTWREHGLARLISSLWDVELYEFASDQFSPIDRAQFRDRFILGGLEIKTRPLYRAGTFPNWMIDVPKLTAMRQWRDCTATPAILVYSWRDAIYWIWDHEIRETAPRDIPDRTNCRPGDPRGEREAAYLDPSRFHDLTGQPWPA